MYHFLNFLKLLVFVFFYTARKQISWRVCSVVYLAFFQWKIIFFYMILKTIKKYWSLTIFHQPMTNKNYSPSGHSVIKLSQYKFPTRTLQSSNQNTLYIIHWWLFFDWLFLKYKNKKLYSIDLSLCVRPGQPHNPKNLKITIWM